jgi:hypothetical protein
MNRSALNAQMTEAQLNKALAIYNYTLDLARDAKANTSRVVHQPNILTSYILSQFSLDSLI